MQLKYKPDFDEAKRHWEAFWAGEIIDRPCIRVVAPKDGVKELPPLASVHDPRKGLLSYVDDYEEYAHCIYFGGDAVPFFYPNFGPDIFSAFIGAELEGFDSGTNTTWARPFVRDWKAEAHKFNAAGGKWWDQTISFLNQAREAAEGKFAVGVLDIHSNMDCLAAIRGQQELCLDLIDCPDDVEAAMLAVRKLYGPIFNSLYQAAGQEETGCLTWLPFYCDGKFAAIQCDFICIISPEHFRRYVMPALEEEAEFLDHCCYHLDGPDALVHLDDLLSIEAIDAIQWIPGAGAMPHIEWMDLLKKIQDANKSLYIGASVDQVPIYQKHLRPEKIFYDVWAPSQAEADALLDRLKVDT